MLRSGLLIIYADQPVTLDSDDLDDVGAGDKAEGASGDVDTR
jgi:hypothetical protein